jgi:hypothetical protein
MSTKLIVMAAAAAVVMASFSTDAMARRGRGADDPAGHVRGEGAGHTLIMKQDELLQMARRGRGADDGPGHQRQCRGCDDGPNHT